MNILRYALLIAAGIGTIAAWVGAACAILEV